MEVNPDIFGLIGDPSKSHARRSGMEIVCDVLRILSEGSLKPTHILYRANVSWKVMNSSVQFLVEKGMVEEAKDGKRTTYTLTERGKSILQLYDALKNVLAGYNNQSARDAIARLKEKRLDPLEERAVAWKSRDKGHYTF